MGVEALLGGLEDAVGMPRRGNVEGKTKDHGLCFSDTEATKYTSFYCLIHIWALTSACWKGSGQPQLQKDIPR